MKYLFDFVLQILFLEKRNEKSDVKKINRIIKKGMVCFGSSIRFENRKKSFSLPKIKKNKIHFWAYWAPPSSFRNFLASKIILFSHVSYSSRFRMYSLYSSSLDPCKRLLCFDYVFVYDFVLFNYLFNTFVKEGFGNGSGSRSRATASHFFTSSSSLLRLSRSAGSVSFCSI